MGGSCGYEQHKDGEGKEELEGEGMGLDPLHVTLLTYSGICGVTAVGKNARKTVKEKRSWS